MKERNFRLPLHEHLTPTRKRGKRTFATALVVLYAFLQFGFLRMRNTAEITTRRAAILQQCEYIKSPAGPPHGFRNRTHSDRHVVGTNPLWLRNAKIWTGARNGTEFIFGDILLDNGLIKAVGYIPPRLLQHPELQIEDAKGAWVTPGLVDLHSHLGLYAAPQLRGSMRVLPSDLTMH